MPKVSTVKNRVKVHIGDLWKVYEEHPERFVEWGTQDVGRTKHSERIAVRLKGKDWQTYAWSFTRGKNGVVKKGRKLFVHDSKMLQILQNLKIGGDLKNYKIINKV